MIKTSKGLNKYEKNDLFSITGEGGLNETIQQINDFMEESDGLKTDILNVAEEVKATTKESYNSAELWEQGTIDISNGVKVDSPLRLRTKSYIPTTITKISTDAPYVFAVFAYDNGAYVGAWDGTTFSKTNELALSQFDFSAVTEYSNYRYRIKFYQSANANVTVDDVVNIHFANDIYNKIKTVDEYHKQQNTELAEKIDNDINDISLWEKGGLDGNGEFSSTNHLRTKNYLSDNVKFVSADGGYVFYALAYDDTNTFVGTWDGTALISGISVKLQSFSMAHLDGYKIRLMVVKSSGTSITVDDASNIHFDNDIYTKIKLIEENTEQQISELTKKIEGDINSITLWEKGGISDTGDYKSSSHIRTKGYISENVELIYSEKGYTFFVVLYDYEGNFVGSWDGKKVSSGLANTVRYVNIKYLANYKIRLMVSGITTLDECESIHFLNSIYANAFYPQPTLTFIDDDGVADALTAWEEISDITGVKITSALITGVMGTGTQATWDEVKRLQNKGFEFISHTHNHINITTTDDEAIIAEFENTVETLRQHGCESRYLVYPYNAIDATKIPLVRKYFSAGIGLGSENDNTLPLYTYHIRRYSFANSVSLDTVKGYIDRAMINGSWVILMTHLAHAGSEVTEEFRNKIVDVCKYAVERGMKIQTFGEAFERYKNTMEKGTVYDSTYYIVDCNGVVHSK